MIAHAEDKVAAARNLSDGAFALLKSLDAEPPGAGLNDAIGAVAGFAGDAQTLADTLSKNERTRAGQAMASLVADAGAVDKVLEKNRPSAAVSSTWSSLKKELAALQKSVQPASRPVTHAAGISPGGSVPPPAAEAAAIGPPPRVRITTRVLSGRSVRIKGFLEGLDLKSAGIYEGEQLVLEVKVGTVAGRQRVNFDLGLEQVTPTETLRVTDSLGRIAEAVVAPAAATAASTAAHEKTIEFDPGVGPAPASPPAVASRGGANTAEIPSASPSRRHMHESGNTLSPLGDVEINILGVTRSMAQANSYEVVGQISGSHVRRAGIYVDDRLVKSIPITPGSYTSFDVTFTMLGREATIRAFGNGSNYVESAIDLSSASAKAYGINPPLAPLNPYPYGMTPYGVPAPLYPPYGYGVNPYVNPYAVQPYGYGPAPYYPPSPPPRRWW